MANPYVEAYQQQANPYVAAFKKNNSSTASPPQRKFEQPKNVRANPLRTIGDDISAPISLLGAAWESVPFLNSKEHKPGNYLADAIHVLTTQGPAALNEKYDPFSDATFQRAGVDPKKVPGYARAVGELGANWYNPANEAIGASTAFYGRQAGNLVKALRGAYPELDAALMAMEHTSGQAFRKASLQAGKVASNIARHLPGSLGAGLRELVDRYSAAGLPQRGGTRFVTSALATQAAPAHAEAVATNNIRALFDGLTTAQKREVQKLSYVDENGGRFATRDGNIPEPAKGPSLEVRAAQVRGMLFDLDRRQEALGIRTRSKVVMPRGKNPNAKPKVVSGDLSDSGRFFPMSQFGDQPVFQSQDLASAAKKQAQDPDALTNVIARRVGRGRSKFSSGVTKAGHKIQRDLPDILNPEVEADLHPEYDPAFQLERHVGETERAIANEQARRDLETLPSIDPETGVQRTTNVPGTGEAGLYARMPLQYYLEPNARRPLAMIFGQGEEGRKGMETYIKRAAQARAQDMARGDQQILDLASKNGVDVNRLGRSVRNVNLSPLKARMAEVQQSGRGAGRLAQNIAGIAGRTKAQLSGRAQDLTMRAEQLGNEADAAASIPKATIKNGMDEGAAAAAQAQNAAREGALNPLPIARAESAAAEAAIAAKNASKGFDRAQAAANGLSDKSAQRLSDLNATFQERAGRAETAAAFQKAVTNYYGHAFEQVAKNIREDATHAPHGYVKESELGLASPSGRDMALDESFADFLKDYKMPHPQSEAAKKLLNAFEVMNRLARMSIVLIPTVHGINNLGMAYLSEGGDPETMAMILAGRKEFPEALKQRAYAAGAATDWSQQSFADFAGGQRGVHATTAIPERAAMIGKKAGPLKSVVTPLANAGLRLERVYNGMNDWLFRKAEQGYAFDMFDRFTKQGMNDGEAALRVRNALGRYDNISPFEITRSLNRIFYFYPWMKTAVAFWTKKGLLDPKWWSAPVRAIEVNNQAQGYDDPSRPFTMTLGKRSDGQFRRYTLPVPQRVLENEAELARVPFDAVRGNMAGVGEDLKAPFNYVAGHFNPAIQMGIDAFDLARQGEQRIAPWNVFKVQPGQTGAQQLGTVARNVLAKFLSPVARAESAPQDPLATIAAYLSGAFTYGVKSQSEQSREKMIRQHADALFHPYIQAATARGDDATVQRLTALREAAIQRAISGAQAQPSLPRAPVPQATPASTAASSNPFM